MLRGFSFDWIALNCFNLKESLKRRAADNFAYRFKMEFITISKLIFTCPFPNFNSEFHMCRTHSQWNILALKTETSKFGFYLFCKHSIVIWWRILAHTDVLICHCWFYNKNSETHFTFALFKFYLHSVFISKLFLILTKIAH